MIVRSAPGVLALLIPLLACQEPGEESAVHAPYSIRSAIVEYAIEGFEQGTETLYIADYGRQQARVRNLTLEHGPENQRAKTLIIENRGVRYIVNLLTNTATASRMPPVLSEGEIEGARADLWAKLGARKKGKAEIAGKTCEIWESEATGSQACIWKGVRLQTVADLGGVLGTKTARSIEENPDIPPERFELPAAVRLSGPVQ